MSEQFNEIFGGPGSGGGGVSPAQLATKQDKDLTAIPGNLAKFNSDGETVDAGTSLADLSLGRIRAGNWDATANTPTLPLLPTAPTYKQGEYYDVTVAGTFNGIDFTVGDRIVIGLDKATNQLMWELDDFGKNASQISYDNTTSGATSTNLQDLGDELAQEIDDLQGKLVYNYFVDNTAGLNAITGMTANEYAIQRDTQTVYKYSGTAWEQYDYNKSEVDNLLDDKVDKINTTAQSNIGSASKTATITINTEGQVTALTEQDIAIASNQVSQATITPTSGIYANGDTQEQINNKGQGQINEAVARIVTVENRPVGNSGEGKRYFISTPATAGIYSATEIFTESPTTITKTFTPTYQTVFEAETQALTITAIPSGGWNTDISFTHTRDKDFTAKVSFYNGATLLGEIESPVLPGNEKIVLSKTFPTFAFTSGNKLKFKLEVKSTHDGDISVFTNDGTNDLHIHTPVLIDVVNSAVQSALDLKQNNIISVANQAAMLALTGKIVGDIVIREDDNHYLYRLTALPASNIANWQLTASNPSTVTTSDINSWFAPFSSLYVSASRGSDVSGTGTKTKPFATRQGALSSFTAGAPRVIYVEGSTTDNLVFRVSDQSMRIVTEAKSTHSGNITFQGINTSIYFESIGGLSSYNNITVNNGGAGGIYYNNIDLTGSTFNENGATGYTEFGAHTSIDNATINLTGNKYVKALGTGSTITLNQSKGIFEGALLTGSIKTYLTGSSNTSTATIFRSGCQLLKDTNGKSLTCTATPTAPSVVYLIGCSTFQTDGTFGKIDFTGAGANMLCYVWSNSQLASSGDVFPITGKQLPNSAVNLLASTTATNYTPTDTSVKGHLDGINTSLGLKANNNAVVHLTGAETIANLKTFSTAPNLSSLTASTRLELDASKNIISVAKNTADNKNYSTTATDIKANGTQSVGTLDTLPRADHIHPIDTTREDVANKVSTFSATPNNTNYITEKLAKDSLDAKVDKVANASLVLDSEITKLAGISAGAEVNVNADWNATTGDAQILNKPTFGTAASKNFGTAIGDIQENGAILGSLQIVETDANGKLKTVAKATGYNLPLGITAGTVVEGGTVYNKSEVDVLLLNTEDKFEIGRRIAKQYSSELYDVTAYLKGLTYTNVSTEAQLLAAILVEGFVVKLTNNITVASQINFAQKGVLHLNGFTINASVPTVVVNITKAVIISGGTLAHEKLTDTTIEVLVKINTLVNERAILHNLTLKHVEFGVDLNGCWALQNVNFEYNTPFGTATDSHRHIAIKTVLGDCFIDNITFSGIPQVATTRYTNFILADITEWTGNLHIRNVKQSAVGALRQFLNFQTLGVNVTAGKLIIQDCNFNDLNGGIFFLTAGALDKMEYIVLTNNEQGGDAIGGFKGLLYFSFAGALGTKAKIIHYNNKTLAGALRADYVSLIPTADTANTGIVARQNTVTINAGQEYAVANKSIVDTFHQDFYRKGENDVALNTKQNITDNTLNTTSKTIVGGINELKTSIDGKVVDAINDGVTSTAPSQNAVFDALALKANIDGAVISNETVTVDNDFIVFSGTTGKIIKKVTLASYKTLLALVKGDVGLGNVDNTTDLNKPISTATQTALDLKQGKVYDYADTQANILSIDPTANNGKTAKATNTLKEYISNGTTWAEVSGGNKLTVGAVQTASFTALANIINPVNTTGGVVIATLPLSPTAGDVVRFTDYANTFGTNKLTLNPNGLKINGSTANVDITTNNADPILTYIDATEGWALQVVASGSGGSGGSGGFSVSADTTTTSLNLNTVTATGITNYSALTSLTNGPTGIVPIAGKLIIVENYFATNGIGQYLLLNDNKYFRSQINSVWSSWQLIATVDTTPNSDIIDGLATPPASPSNGDAYVILANPTGAWSTFAQGTIATYNESTTSWVNTVPANGSAITFSNPVNLNSINSYYIAGQTYRYNSTWGSPVIAGLLWQLYVASSQFQPYDSQSISLSLVSNVVTATCPQNHNLAVGYSVTMSSSPNNAFNETVTVTAIVSPTVFRYAKTLANTTTTGTLKATTQLLPSGCTSVLVPSTISFNVIIAVAAGSYSNGSTPFVCTNLRTAPCYIGGIPIGKLESMVLIPNATAQWESADKKYEILNITAHGFTNASHQNKVIVMTGNGDTVWTLADSGDLTRVINGKFVLNVIDVNRILVANFGTVTTFAAHNLLPNIAYSYGNGTTGGAGNLVDGTTITTGYIASNTLINYRNDYQFDWYPDKTFHPVIASLPVALQTEAYNKQFAVIDGIKLNGVNNILTLPTTTSLRINSSVQSVFIKFSGQTKTPLSGLDQTFTASQIPVFGLGGNANPTNPNPDLLTTIKNINSYGNGGSSVNFILAINSSGRLFAIPAPTATPNLNFVDAITNISTLTSGQIGFEVNPLKAYRHNGTIIELYDFVLMGQVTWNGAVFSGLVNYAFNRQSTIQWFAVAVASSYPIQHNIGTTSINCTVWCSSSSTGANPSIENSSYTFANGAASASHGAIKSTITPTSIIIKTGADSFNISAVPSINNPQTQPEMLTSGYYKVFCSSTY